MEHYVLILGMRMSESTGQCLICSIQHFELEKKNEKFIFNSEFLIWQAKKWPVDVPILIPAYLSL